jgi:SSS family transporter
MTALDWIIVALYLAGMVAMSVYLGRGQRDEADYYVGGRNLPWWAVGISTMATQTSANSFLGIPAYVALKESGGLTWLQYELAVPLAMIAIMILLIPFFRKLELVSVYEYLELRFGPEVRYLISAVFLVSRGLATGIGLYAIAIVLTVILGIPLWATILLIGVTTVVYDTIGGMAAVVYSDVVQLVVLLGGLLLLIGLGISEAGGLGAALAAVPEERLKAVDWGHGINDGTQAPFWAFLFGGFFLYASYYGTDQSQVQRELSAPTLEDTKRSLVLNGLARFPLTLLYLLLGLVACALYLQAPELEEALAGTKEALGDKNANALVPHMILLYLPTGVRAILIAALLAAAMSSLDSALNSLSAATMKDFVSRGRDMVPDQELLLSKSITVVWGAAIIGCALMADQIEGSTVVELINKVGSAFYGPILAAFTIGVLSRRANARGLIAGVLGGVGFNLALWILAPGGVDEATGEKLVEVSFWWWNLTGMVVAVVLTLLVSVTAPPPAEEKVAKYTLRGTAMLEDERTWLPTYAVLVGYFVVILLCCVFADDILKALAG